MICLLDYANGVYVSYRLCQSEMAKKTADMTRAILQLKVNDMYACQYGIDHFPNEAKE